MLSGSDNPESELLPNSSSVLLVTFTSISFDDVFDDVSTEGEKHITRAGDTLISELDDVDVDLVAIFSESDESDSSICNNTFFFYGNPSQIPLRIRAYFLPLDHFGGICQNINT